MDGIGLGTRIATYRRRRGLSQAALAGLVGSHYLVECTSADCFIAWVIIDDLVLFVSTAEEIEAGRKQSEYWANPGASRPQPKSDPTGKGGFAPKNDNVIPFGPTGNTGGQGGRGGTGRTARRWRAAWPICGVR